MTCLAKVNIERKTGRIEKNEAIVSWAESTCSQDDENQQHQLEDEERNDDEVDGSHVDAAVDFRRTVGKVDVVPVDVVLQQHVQQSYNIIISNQLHK